MVKKLEKKIYRGKLLDKPILLGYGKKHGYYWVILTIGTCPTAYIGINTKHPFYGKDCDDIENVYVHGGLNYSDDHLHCNPFKGDIWWLGWDYGHHDDYQDYGDYQELGIERLKLLTTIMGGSHKIKWTFKEIKEEIMILIKQLKKMKLYKLKRKESE